MSDANDLRLNQMGIAVWLFDKKQLANVELREAPDTNELSAGKSYVLKEQAKVFLKSISDPLRRKYFCTIGSGQGLVVRVAPRGEKAYYELSPFLKKALETVPDPKETTDEAVELYVRNIIRVANASRGHRRSGRKRL